MPVSQLQSLRARILAVTGTVFVLSSLVLVSFHFIQSRRSLLMELEKRGFAFTESLGFRVSHALGRRDREQLARDVFSTYQGTDACYVIVQDKDGQVLTHAAEGDGLLAQVRPELVTRCWEPEEPERIEIRTGDGVVYNFSAPVWRDPESGEGGGERLATIRVGFYTAPTLGLIQRTFWLSLGMWAAILAAGLAATAMVARWTLRPLERMAGVARSIATGDLTQRVEVRSGDEIGVLGEALNEMSRSLAANREALAGRNEELQRNAAEKDRLYREARERSARLIELYDELQASYAELKEIQRRLAESENTHRAEKLRSVGQMASGVAHDFNNVLAAITGRVQLLRLRYRDSELADDEFRRSLEVIERAARDGAETVRRIQEMSKEKATGGEMVRSDLNHIVREVVEITRPRWKNQSEQRGVRVEVNVRTERVPTVACVPSEIRESLTNLVFNAVDAMPGGGTIELRTFSRNGRVELEVSDTGEGMPEEVCRRVFEPFFTTKGVQGNGLGLSMVHGIVQRHGGEITVRSRPGKGTTFTISLPPAGSSARKSEDELVMSNRPCRILVGDDEAAVRETLVSMLNALGHEAVAEAEGRLVLFRFEREPFDLVFTDLGMPDMSGWEVTRRIRERNPDIPVVLVTGWGNQIEREEWEARGVTRVMAKPFTLERISSLIAELQGLQKAA